MNQVEKLACRIKDILENKKIKTLICGSIRRKATTISKIVIVVNHKADFVIKILESQFILKLLTNLHTSKKTFTIVIHNISVKFIISTKESWGASILHATGSSLFNAIIRGIAKKQGYKLNEWGLWCGEIKIAGITEEQIFDALGLKFLPPEKRSIYHKDVGKSILREDIFI